ncbi:hypothetical protein LOAG_01019 [Loa loa]|uniref:Uncharacterized protein n=1 Tax=Loa loa TaxID=7209 RepID=A0A1S0U9Y9_LOALO|nr:hypothetical protein LOAG_01019 [Loa loa]EFO27471.1 hypothetical protein LOAG_01019 [Loa loa]
MRSTKAYTCYMDHVNERTMILNMEVYHGLSFTNEHLERALPPLTANATNAHSSILRSGFYRTMMMKSSERCQSILLLGGWPDRLHLLEFGVRVALLPRWLLPGG